MERIDYWRGFTGGLIAGVAIGAWIYFSPRVSKEVDDLKELAEKEPGKFSLDREAQKIVHSQSM
ncbi:MAG TPA: hypothetical protein VEV40_14650 [Alloacidobacterium sp.]|nr:hypothetical protein [Alloacidobacterium sp.]